MSFGSKEFDVREFCQKKFNLKPSSIIEVEEKRTYKKFVEYTVHWLDGEDKGTYVFKIIKQKLES